MRSFIYVTLCILLLLCGCSSEKSGSYSSTSLCQSLENALLKGKSQFSIICESSSFTEEDIRSDLKHCLTEDYLASCLLKDAEFSCTEDASHTEIIFTLTYHEITQFEGSIYDVSDDKVIRKVLKTMLEKGAPKTAILLRNYTLSEDAIFDLLDEAEANCATAPCEATALTYALFDPAEDIQLLVAWGEYPITAKEYAEKKVELTNAITEYSKNWLRNTSTETDTYRSIFDLICELVEYDKNIESLTLADSNRLTTSMHINRSAYGALITQSTVCTGYARGFKAICDELQLPCYVIIGTNNNVPHAWNAVLIDKQVYYIDCTVADTNNANVNPFLFTPEEAHNAGYVEASCCTIPW